MDRSFEQIRTEVLELDRESQRKLAVEIEENLSDFEIGGDVYAEANRRMEAHRRGEGSSMSMEESLARGKALIEQAKRSKK